MFARNVYSPFQIIHFVYLQHSTAFILCNLEKQGCGAWRECKHTFLTENTSQMLGEIQCIPVPERLLVGEVIPVKNDLAVSRKG